MWLHNQFCIIYLLQSYVAVATNTTVYGSITEHQVVNFENGTVNHANETYLEPFCQV